ncbi:hypothetical protein sphantq_04431 (plasmid) [Sphingobium sp. AntQ-1]|nr:hypothetical protein sphantq_04431 [Sphingobium sp. AntQ-1]
MVDAVSTTSTLALPQLVDRISNISKRPRYALLVLNLIAQKAGRNGSLGPYVQSAQRRVPVRDWLCQALAPLAQRDCRRLAMIKAARAEMMSNPARPKNPAELERQVEEEVRLRILRSGRTNVSRAVSDLVRAGLLRRHYQGYRIDHLNRGAQREAVYTITLEIRQALSQH